MLSNPSGRAFSRLFMWGRASTAEPNDRSLETDWKNCSECVYIYPQRRLVPPLQQVGISFGSDQGSCEPQLTLPCYDQRALENKSTNIHGRIKNITKKVGQFDGSGKRVWSISQKSATRTSIDRSLSAASVEDVFPRILVKRKLLWIIHYVFVTMSSSIQGKYATLSFCHLCNLLGQTGKTETWVSCTMMANHNSPITNFWRSIIDTTIQIPRGNGNLQSIFEETRCRNRGEIRVGGSLGLWT